MVHSHTGQRSLFLMLFSSFSAFSHSAELSVEAGSQPGRHGWGSSCVTLHERLDFSEPHFLTP